MWEWAAIGTLTAVVGGLLVPTIRQIVNMQRAIDAGNIETTSLKNEMKEVKSDMRDVKSKVDTIATTVARIEGHLQGKFGGHVG